MATFSIEPIVFYCRISEVVYILNKYTGPSFCLVQRCPVTFIITSQGFLKTLTRGPFPTKTVCSSSSYFCLLAYIKSGQGFPDRAPQLKNKWSFSHCSCYNLLLYYITSGLAQILALRPILIFLLHYVPYKVPEPLLLWLGSACIWTPST